MPGLWRRRRVVAWRGERANPERPGAPPFLRVSANRGCAQPGHASQGPSRLSMGSASGWGESGPRCRRLRRRSCERWHDGTHGQTERGGLSETAQNALRHLCNDSVPRGPADATGAGAVVRRHRVFLKFCKAKTPALRNHRGIPAACAKQGPSAHCFILQNGLSSGNNHSGTSAS